jgi:hypothetical protein
MARHLKNKLRISEGFVAKQEVSPFFEGNFLPPAKPPPDFSAFR